MAKESTESSLTVAELAAMGGRARAEALTEKERSDIARHAAQKRWKNTPKKAKKRGKGRKSE